jgi:hypothetical protein
VEGQYALEDPLWVSLTLPEWHSACQNLVDQHAQGVEVRRRAQPLALDRLRSLHVGRPYHCDAAQGWLRPNQLESNLAS